jgi:hypothetical protein
MEAALAISKLVKHSKVAKDYLQPAISTILEGLLKIMEEMESEDLVDALSSIMHSFKDSMSIHAIEFVDKIVSNHTNLISSHDITCTDS